MHTQAMYLRTQPSLEKIYPSTPIGPAVAEAEKSESKKLAKPVDIAYTLAKEELLFSKFPAVADLEFHHGVNLGQTYITQPKAREFTGMIGEVMQEELLDLGRNSDYIIVLTDGSTDMSNIEKELFYICFVNLKTGTVSLTLLGLHNIEHAHAEGLHSLLVSAFADPGVDITNKLVGFCTDGASINKEWRKGLATLSRPLHLGCWLCTV